MSKDWQHSGQSRRLTLTKSLVLRNRWWKHFDSSKIPATYGMAVKGIRFSIDKATTSSAALYSRAAPYSRAGNLLHLLHLPQRLVHLIEQDHTRLLMPVGEIGVAGAVCFRTASAAATSMTFLHVGYDFDFNIFLILSRPKASSVDINHPIHSHISVERLHYHDVSLGSNDQMMELLGKLRADRYSDCNLIEDGVQLHLFTEIAVQEASYFTAGFGLVTLNDLESSVENRLVSVSIDLNACEPRTDTAVQDDTWHIQRWQQTPKANTNNGW